MEQLADDNSPRRSPRRAALVPLNRLPEPSSTIVNISEDARTPSLAADEFIIQQRGRRRKPITWSPVDYNKTDVLGRSRDQTPDRVPQRAEISSKLRRRLVMNPIEDVPTELGDAIAKKLRVISNVSKGEKARQQQ